MSRPMSFKCTPSSLIKFALSPSSCLWRTTTPNRDLTNLAIRALTIRLARSTAPESLAPCHTTLGTISDHTRTISEKKEESLSISERIRMSSSGALVRHKSFPPACITKMTGPAADPLIWTTSGRT
ncbi:hypothetical protein GDO81_018957 [Engystomops pustulosus]|uniref:Uncharacterized protein n=1 Tax=Engystomops pustulosus TaxID=76066 RepID=A0AAV6YKV7_ENGPU|nr:hypothetical protein GDO81_018957 [Engystomops pustulosus]